MKKGRMMIDVGMVALLPFLMAYSLIGELFHEIAGTAMFILFIAHHILNRKWFGSIRKGSYNAQRIVSTTVNLLLLLVMILLPVSGILMSKYLYTFLPVTGLTYYARLIHMLTAFWGFVLMCVHLGLHISMMKGMIGKAAKKPQMVFRIIGVISVLISIYGIYAFYKRQLAFYLFMRTEFVLFDFSEPRVFFFLDYIAIMVMITTVTYFLSTVGTKNK